LVSVPSCARLVAFAAGLFLLSACGHTPVTLTVAEAFRQDRAVDGLTLRPELRYLRVSAQGRSALMVLGYLEPAPAGPVEVWYSNGGEVLKLQAGRVVGTVGLAVDWRAVRYIGLPSWADIAARPVAEFARQRDEMPGYRYGITETVVIRQVRPPTDARLSGVSASSLLWFEETVAGPGRPLPSARYGLRAKGDAVEVVYGEQCFAPDQCMAWQAWPAQP
jgi:hypothetical protein